MGTRWLGTLAAVATVAFATLPARADDACWKLIDTALKLSAGAPHSRFITYGEHTTVYADGQTLENIRATVVYRDDGVAYIDDDRWVHPFISGSLEPGPPVLGPYRDRSAWLSFGKTVSPFPIIAQVVAHPAESCNNVGVDSIGGKRLAHLAISYQQRESAGLRDVWIDPQAYQIERVVVRAPLRFYVYDSIKQKLADYTVDLQRVDGYTVVNRVTWQYREYQYSQWTDFAAEYDFGDYRFSSAPPPGTLPVDVGDVGL